MKNAIIYGTARMGRQIYEDIQIQNSENGGINVIAFTDFYSENYGNELFGKKIIPLHDLNNHNYDVIIPASITHHEIIRDELVSLYKIDPQKIDINYSRNIKIYSDRARETFIRYHAKMIYEKKIEGSVAEGGVHKGLFAAKINYWYPDRKFYLFDTFEGFDERDVIEERESGGYKHEPGFLGDTSVDLVLSRLPNKGNVIVKKGYFPDTTEGVEDNFVFVNLDFDLYNPMLAGLEYFYPRMKKGGIILLHDYFSDFYVGAPKAVDEFCEKYNVSGMPIGDLFSIAIVK